MFSRLMTTEECKAKKRKVLRHNEYYNIQNVFDKLYKDSQNNKSFNNLYEIIISRENILLAYRNIKSNKGSKTKGSNNSTILDICGLDNDRLVEYIRNRLCDYKPHSIRRKYIPKKNGKLRPLGIPTIEDRIIQQCFKQVLEPICEAKFHNDSYGFRPNRSVSNAVAKCYNYINVCKCNYVVDIDIKGFFDNVSHSKLLKQLWTLGIRDKKVLCIIGKILRAEIEGEGIPNKGTPQGGILSPLLANVVLNELDWWIDSQWLGFKANQITNSGRITNKPYKNTSNKLLALRRTKLKPCFIVRYADDFKIFTNNYNNAQKLFHATKNWLRERLELDISEEKSKVVNLRTHYSEFLGFKIKTASKIKDGESKQVVKSKMLEKEKLRIQKEIKKIVYKIKDDATPVNMYKLNSLILGVHNYYNIATNVNSDFNDIEHRLYKFICFSWKDFVKSRGELSLTYKKFYGDYKSRKQLFVKGIALYPISGIKFKRPTVFNKEISSYTEKGREYIHKKLDFINNHTFKHIASNPVAYRSVEYNDNRLSLYTGQKGKCAITGIDLRADNIHCHHKIPRSKNGTDKYQNLILLIDEIHLLIHTNKGETQRRILRKFNIDKSMLNKINDLRNLVGNYNITDYKLI